MLFSCKPHALLWKFVHLLVLRKISKDFGYKGFQLDYAFWLSFTPFHQPKKGNSVALTSQLPLCPVPGNYIQPILEHGAGQQGPVPAHGSSPGEDGATRALLVDTTRPSASPSPSWQEPSRCCYECFAVALLSQTPKEVPHCWVCP